jgi:hypothetical protein
METIEQKVKHTKTVLDCIWLLRNEYYRMHGLHPTTVIISETLLSELEFAYRRAVLSITKKSEAEIYVFGLNITVGHNMGDDEIRMGCLMAMKINNE